MSIRPLFDMWDIVNIWGILAVQWINGNTTVYSNAMKGVYASLYCQGDVGIIVSSNPLKALHTIQLF